MRLSWNLDSMAARAVCALLLFVAAFHAALPGDQPLTLHTGSAFSAGTSDVVTSCASRTELERPAPLEAKAKAPPPSCLAPLRVLASANLPQAEFAVGQPRAPPRREPALAPVNPRAPPAA